MCDRPGRVFLGNTAKDMALSRQEVFVRCCLNPASKNAAVPPDCRTASLFSFLLRQSLVALAKKTEQVDEDVDKVKIKLKRKIYGQLLEHSIVTCKGFIALLYLLHIISGKTDKYCHTYNADEDRNRDHDEQASASSLSCFEMIPRSETVQQCSRAAAMSSKYSQLSFRFTGSQFM